MNTFKLNYYTLFLTLFRTAVIIETLYFIVYGEIELAIYGVLTFGTTFLFNILYKFIKLNPSMFIKFTVQLFIFLSMFLGHINNMYQRIPNWDDILHILSGFIISLFGYLILQKFDNKRKTLTSNKYFVAFYIIIFGLASAGFWEIFEFTSDQLFSLMSQGGSLVDTMIDIINGTIAPIVIAIIYIKKPNIFKNM